MMNTLIFDSIFKNEIQDLINLKRAQGFKYVTEEFALKRIDKYLAGKNIQEKVITKSVVDEWCLRKTYEIQTNQNSRISIMRILCSYLSELGFDAYVPPKRLTRKAPKYNAHIYTDDELRRFFEAVDKSRSVPSECPYRHIIMPIFFRILYTSGLRVSELRLAKIEDFHLDEGYFIVKSGKNNKDRIIPIHPVLVKKCKELKSTIHIDSDESEYFFMKLPGKPLTLQCVYKNFRRYLDKAEISHNGRGPRVHDFRHTYCVNLLKKWVYEEKNLLVYLPYMKTMLGHESFDETAYYLKLTATLFPMIQLKLESSYPNIIETIEEYDSN